MKINKNFALRTIAGTCVALPLGKAAVDFNGMLTINESGVVLWKLLEKGCTRDDMIDAILNEYDVTREVAECDVDSFIKKLSDAGCIED